jgi:hypothetical protein
MAFPGRRRVYAQGVYASRGQNSTCNSTDNVFADGTNNELATMVGARRGYTATLQIRLRLWALGFGAGGRLRVLRVGTSLEVALGVVLPSPSPSPKPKATGATAVGCSTHGVLDRAP